MSLMVDDAISAPPAVELKKAIAETRQALKASTDEAEQQALKLELNALQLKYSVVLDSMMR